MGEKIDAERDTKALELRRAGITPAEIRNRLGYRSVAAVDAALRRALKEATVEPALIRGIEMDRLDRLHQAVWENAVDGDVQAVDRVMRLAELRMKLTGVPDDAMVMRNAFDETVAALTLEPADKAMVASGRRIAEQIDLASASGDGVQVTKALYLIPHLLNVLDKLGASPAARNEVGKAAPGLVVQNDLEAFKKKQGIV